MKERSREEIEKDLKEAQDFLKDVQDRGDDALGEYDLKMGYDADFYLNKCPMLASHIAWYQAELDKLVPTLF